jgi:hypothetical protein
MGIIIHLPVRANRRRRAQSVVPHVCEIIILPCVRYERWTCDTSASRPQAQKATKKKSKRRARVR